MGREALAEGDLLASNMKSSVSPAFIQRRRPTIPPAWLWRVIVSMGLVSSCQLPGANVPKPEATIQVHSVRLSRAGTDLNKRFPNRYYGDSTPSVSIQLLLTLSDGTMLPVARDAVAIETFVDDTYQSLLSTGSDTYQRSEFQPTVSEDGRMLLFTVHSSRAPAPEAGRVFVRGSVEARVNRGQPKIATNLLTLSVGQEIEVGPFQTTVRSVTESGSSASVTLAVKSDASRILKTRLLDSRGRDLNEDRSYRSFPADSGERPSSVHFSLRYLPKEAITVEFTYAETPQQVKIPFEAQVDFGVTKAGPLESSQGKPPKRGASRTWPPPREGLDDAIPPRRAAFNPPKETGHAPAATLDKAAVDLFSLTVAKPPPSEVKEAVWKNPPSPSFFASGFTIARLMLSIPGACIISIPPDAVSVTRFEDDKGGHLDPTLYRDSASGFSPFSASSLRRSPDGQQAILNVSLASAPTPGATRCTLQGDIQARVGRGEKTNACERLELKKGEKFTAGPFHGTLTQIRQTAPATPAAHESSDIEVWLALTGPVGKVSAIEFLDRGRMISASTAPFTRSLGESSSERAETTTQVFRLNSNPTGPLTCRIRCYDSDETIRVPFNLNMSVGL